MTELDVMQRAKMYMDKLARGIDPITDREVQDDSVLNNVRLARCFLYVSDVLDQVIANGGRVGKHEKTLKFSITPQELGRVRIVNEPILITSFSNNLYVAVNNPDMKRPNVLYITDWLRANGFLTTMTDENGKKYRIPTELGARMGMSSRMRSSGDGEYHAVYYDANMQRFLLDHLNEILADK